VPIIIRIEVEEEDVSLEDYYNSLFDLLGFSEETETAIALVFQRDQRKPKSVLAILELMLRNRTTEAEARTIFRTALAKGG